MIATSNPKINISPVVPTHPDETFPNSTENSWMINSAVAKRQKEDEEIRNYLLQIDLLRQEFEKNGKYRKAQQCVDRIREINLRYAKKIEIEARKVNVGWKNEMMEEQQLELLTFNEMWENKMMDYDNKAKILRNQLDRQYIIDMKSQEDIIRLELMERRPRPSKILVHLRDELKNFVQKRMYIEAERLKKKVILREKEEEDEFEIEFEKKLKEKLNIVSERLRIERTAIEQRLSINREELLSKRKQDFDILVKKHNAAMRGQEQVIALIISKAQDCINRQVKAYIRDPVKTGLELIHLSSVAFSGKGSNELNGKIIWGASGRRGTSFLSSQRSNIEKESLIEVSPTVITKSSRPPWQN